MDGRSQIKHTNERTQVHSAQSTLAVTHPSETVRYLQADERCFNSLRQRQRTSRSTSVLQGHMYKLLNIIMFKYAVKGNIETDDSKTKLYQ